MSEICALISVNIVPGKMMTFANSSWLLFFGRLFCKVQLLINYKSIIRNFCFKFFEMFYYLAIGNQTNMVR